MTKAKSFKSILSIRDKELAVIGSDEPELEEEYKNIAVDDIYSEKQIRNHFKLEKIEQLMSSMLISGQIEPIIVCELDGKGYRIQKGEGRWRAAKMSNGKITHLKCLVRKDAGTVLSQFSENFVRSDFTPFEIGEGFLLIKEEQSWSNKDLAQHFKVSESVVASYIKCIESSDFIKEAYTAGKISDVDTVNSLRISSGINLEAVVSFVVNNERITRSQAQELTKSLKAKIKTSEATSTTGITDTLETRSVAKNTDSITTEEKRPELNQAKLPVKKTQNRIKVMVDDCIGVIDHTAKAEEGFIVVLMNESPGQMTVPVCDVILVGYAS